METIFEILQWAFWIVIFLPGALLIIIFCIFCVFSVMADLEYWQKSKKRKTINFYEDKEKSELTLPLKIQIKVLKHAIKIAKQHKGYDIYLIISQSISKCTNVPFYKVLLDFDLYIPLFNKVNINSIHTIMGTYGNKFWLPETQIFVFKTLLKEVRKKRIREIINKIFKLK